MRYPVLHAGVTNDGRIVVSRGDGNAAFLDDGASHEQRRARGDIAVRIKGPWVFAPGILADQIIGQLANGKKVTASMAGWVYNDAGLVDDLCGAGTYERVMPSDEVAILQLARPLYLGA
jgi:hypothetical protein